MDAREFFPLNRVIAGALLASALLMGVTATAAPVNVVAQRAVTVGDALLGPITGPNSPSAALGAFSDSVTATVGAPLSPQPATATQTSNIDPLAGNFSGAGHVDIAPSVLQQDVAFANSFFDVFFDLTAAHGYVLSGQLDANVDGGKGEARFRLLGPTGIDIGAIDFDSIVLADSGILAAGSYHLTVFANYDNGGGPFPGGFMAGTADFSFDFSLTEIAVPEPASLALLGLGLAGIGFVRRRRAD